MLFTGLSIYIVRYSIIALALIFFTSCAAMGNLERETKLLSDQFYELLAAEVAIQLDDKQQSLEHYYKAALLTEDREIHRSAIALSVNVGDYQKAKELAERWYREDSENIELNRIMVLIYLQSEDYLKAMQHIQVLLTHKVGFDSQQMLPLLATIKFEKGQEILDKLEQATSEHAAIHWLRAYLSFYYGRYENALTQIEQALASNPDLITAITLKADILFAMSRNSDALEWLTEQAISHPQSFFLQAKVALALQNYGHTIPAQKFYQAAYRLDSTEADFVLQYAIFKIDANDLDMAKQLLLRYAELSGNADIVNYYTALLAEKDGDMQTAIAYYQAVKLENLRVEAKLNIAKIYQTQGRFDKSDQQFQALREFSESEAERIRYYIVQTTALRKGGFNERAMQLYNQALTQYPDSLSLLYSRGMLGLEMELFDLFEQDLRRVIELDENNWQALNALGYTLIDHNRQIEAAKDYIYRAYELNPTEPAIIDSMGWLHFRLNNLELAEFYIRKAAAIYHDAEILGHWVEILISMQKRDQAIRLLNEALIDFPESDYLLRLHHHISP